MSLASFEIPFPAILREPNFAFGDRKNAAFPRMVSSDNSRRPHVLLLGFNDQKCGDLSDHFKRRIPCMSLSRETSKLSSISRRFSKFDAIIINFDAFEDVESGIDALLSFREENPQVGIVLVSSHVARDEFGGHRKMLCDSTLRYPVTSDRLIEVTCPLGSLVHNESLQV